VTDLVESITNQPQWNTQLAKLLRACYEEIPPAAIREAHGKRWVALCPHCGWALNWKRDEAACHIGGICQRLVGDLAEHARWEAYIPGMHRTKEGVQRSVSAPEIDLMRLYQKLSHQWGVQVALYPNLDAYDLLITFVDGRRWAVDMKDHQNPTRLALHLNETIFPYLPRWDAAFYVFPDYRATAEYLNRFENNWNGHKGVTFVSYSAFVKQVNEALQP
jgi:hypothetical protein